MAIISADYEKKQHVVFQLPASSIQNPASWMSNFHAIRFHIGIHHDFLMMNSEFWSLVIMQEIRIHGRGGQGTVVASILLAKAFFNAGYWVQTFPVFGVERRGAPVESYLRLDKDKILIRSNVYSPNHVVVQDIKLLESVDVTAGLKPGGWVLVNDLRQPHNLNIFSVFQFAYVYASGIAFRNRIGTHSHPIINTAMIGAFTRML